MQIRTALTAGAAAASIIAASEYRLAHLPRLHAHSFRLDFDETTLNEHIRFRGVDEDNADPAMLTLHLPSVAAAGLDDTCTQIYCDF